MRDSEEGSSEEDIRGEDHLSQQVPYEDSLVEN